MSKLYSNKGLTQAQLEVRNLAMVDLRAFVGLVAPQRMLGHCHQDMLQFLTKDVTHQLVIWPRGHQKSTLIGYWVAWHIINNPDTTVIYASATASLAESQLTLIKRVLESSVVSKYWPELLLPEEGKRSMWRADSISTDHWKRDKEVIRDPSVKAVGMGANITGFHADVVILDDIVVKENAETKTERDKVSSWYSLLTSILNPGGMIKAVGTRYHINDLYSELMEMVEEEYDDEGSVIKEHLVYEYSVKVVEIDGEFLWPRQRRKDGRWYGFNQKELAKIKAQYLDKSQFFSQYYNDPSDPVNKRISNFNYYEREHLVKNSDRWFVKDKSLNVYAAIDFAATMTQRSDYTAIVVIGIDSDHVVYLLDIDRFKTDKISVMADHLETLFDKWRWIKLRAEVNAQQNLIVEQLKEFNRQRGVFYSIDKINQRVEKELRIMTNLEPRYSQNAILHYRGGHCQVLEDELSATKPAHDDISDALASVVEIAVAPSSRKHTTNVRNISCHPKFGGMF